jgi:hypothetical protein
MGGLELYLSQFRVKKALQQISKPTLVQLDQFEY